MTVVILKSGKSVFTALPFGEVREYLQKGNKGGSFRAWLDSAMVAFPIEVSSQDIAYIDVEGNTQVLGSSPGSSIVITPSDTVDLPSLATVLYIGGAGNVKVNLADGTTVVLTALAIGIFHHIAITRIWATGTTATNILAFN